MPMAWLMAAPAQAEALRVVTAVQLENPPIVMYAKAPPPKLLASAPLLELPAGVQILHLHRSLQPGKSGESGVNGKSGKSGKLSVVIRLQNVIPKPAGETARIPSIRALIKGKHAVKCKELTLFLDQERGANEVKSMNDPSRCV